MFESDGHISYNKFIAFVMSLIVFQKKLYVLRGTFVENRAIVLYQAMVRVADYNY